MSVEIIGTYNLNDVFPHQDRRYDETLGTILCDEEPSIFMLQEVCMEDDVRLLKHTVADTLGRDYRVLTAPLYRDNPKSGLAVITNLDVLLHARLDYGLKSSKNDAQLLRLRSADGVELEVINVHHEMPWPTEFLRYFKARVLSRRMKQELPVIVAGDTNAPDAFPSSRKLKRGTISVVDALPPNDRWTWPTRMAEHYAGNPEIGDLSQNEVRSLKIFRKLGWGAIIAGSKLPKYTVDRMQLNDYFKIREAKVLGTGDRQLWQHVSDHRALLAEVEII